MYPTIVPTYAFKLATYIIRRVKLPFTDMELFNEFSALLETLVLSDEIRYYNIGPQQMEWETGNIYRDYPNIHPYESFNKMNFIKESSHTSSNQKISLKQDVGGEITKAHFEGRNYHGYTVGVYNMCIVRAYNGDFGDVSIIIPPLIDGLLPKLLVYNDSNHSIIDDPLIVQSYKKLKEVYADKLKDIDINNTIPFNIPPLTSILLDRLPDNCTDPFIITNEILQLREELTSVRKRFNEYQQVFYDQSASIREVQKVYKAINIDSEVFTKKFNASYIDNTYFQMFLDNVALIVKLLTKGEVDYDEVAASLAKISPQLVDRLGINAPTKMYSFAMKASNINKIGSLAQRKLGLDI